LVGALAHAPDPDFLGVRRSLTGRPWRWRAASEDLVRAHRALRGVSEPVARAMAARGVSAADGGSFLEPTFRSLFPDPSSFADMDSAARILIDALVADRPMVVFADYDVDGAASAAQLVRWFRALGKDLPIHVPDRMAEGYGPSPAAFRRLREAGVELVVTLDCGACAHDAIAAAGEVGLTVVVIDHHQMRATAPGAAALVNPNRADCASGQGVLAAAGVTFVLLAALNREGRRRGLFADRTEPDLRRWLDLAALGGICDVTQLVGFNRALTVQGLKVMSAWANPGLAALMTAAGAARLAPGVFECGFILGPRINAGGRIGRSDLGARLLATDDPAEAADLAAQLDALNHERRSVEAEILRQAIAAIETQDNLEPAAPAIVVAREDWHPGVVGIVASRLRERYRKPVVVIGLDRQGDIGRGSGRSQAGVDLGAAVGAAFDAGLLMSGGGHPMAAGLAIRPAAVPEFRDFLCERLAAEAGAAALADAVEIDALVTPAAAGRPLLDEFAALAPFGPGNPEPVFALAAVTAERPMEMRGGHIRCTLADAAGVRLRAVAWRALQTDVGRRLMAGAPALHVAGRLRPDDWNGRAGAQLEIEDLADPRRV
jgi:single-stranded-DNA-specific exonuclease